MLCKRNQKIKPSMSKLIRFIFCVRVACSFSTAVAQQKIIVQVNENKTYQTIRNFAASDAWSCQYVGNWPDEKKNAIADWLFSMDTLPNGSPKGIGLTMWRYNIGAGSAEQNDSSTIVDEWHRAALVNKNTVQSSELIKAQNWFLLAAKKRGVQQFLGFFNSPPVQLTINGKAHATAGICNIDSSNYKAFANYTVDAVKNIKESTGIEFNYISPVNEPQWDWSDNKQEGCPYDNIQIRDVVKNFSSAFAANNIASKILLTESGQLNYLLKDGNKPGKGNQVNNFFNPSSANYIGNIASVHKAIAGHSYFTTSPFDEAMALRKEVKDSVEQIKGLEFWQSEYCILGDNAGEIDGNKRDLGMSAALYTAKVIYEDLVAANASAWQWWLAVSPYDYKDGLVYIDKNKTGGNYYDSKMLWAMGNYSRFVRAGMKRIDVEVPVKNILVSGYKDTGNGTLVLVFVNASSETVPVSLDNEKKISNRKIYSYTTSETKNLEKNIAQINDLTIPAKSVVTLVIN
jgi:O-glycosyl hydrolase